MKLLGATISGYVKEIKLSDCPSVIDDGQVACLALPNSDIFYSDSIVYMEESANVTEGDLVYEDGEYIGVAYYNRGWRVHSDNFYYKELRVTEHISMKCVDNNYDKFKMVNKLQGRQNVAVYANGYEFSIFNLAMYKNKQIVFMGQNQSVYCDELYLATGYYNRNNKSYYFGQYLNGGILGLDESLNFVIKSNTEIKIIKMEDL